MITTEFSMNKVDQYTCSYITTYFILSCILVYCTVAYET